MRDSAGFRSNLWRYRLCGTCHHARLVSRNHFLAGLLFAESIGDPLKSTPEEVRCLPHGAAGEAEHPRAALATELWIEQINHARANQHRSQGASGLRDIVMLRLRPE